MLYLSGWQDSNLRPPGPKPGAITGLRYTPKAKKSGETGTRTLATVTRRQISNLLHYRSGTSPVAKNLTFFAVANVMYQTVITNFLSYFFDRFFTYFLKLLKINRIQLSLFNK
jgi:hypothetical protein